VSRCKLSKQNFVNFIIICNHCILLYVYVYDFYTRGAGISHYRVSVCLCVTCRYCIKTAKCRIGKQRHVIAQGLYNFLMPKVVGGCSPSLWNLRSKWPTPFQKPQFWPIFAHSASTVRAGEKGSVSTNRKSTTRFPTSHRWTVYVTSKSPKGWHKTRFCCFFPLKFNFCRKKSSTKFFVWKLPAAKL